MIKDDIQESLNQLYQTFHHCVKNIASPSTTLNFEIVAKPGSANIEEQAKAMDSWVDKIASPDLSIEHHENELVVPLLRLYEAILTGLAQIMPIRPSEPSTQESISLKFTHIKSQIAQTFHTNALSDDIGTAKEMEQQLIALIHAIEFSLTQKSTEQLVPGTSGAVNKEKR